MKEKFFCLSRITKKWNHGRKLNRSQGVFGPLGFFCGFRNKTERHILYIFGAVSQLIWYNSIVINWNTESGGAQFMKKMLLMLAICLCMIPADVYAADLGRQTLGTNDGWGAASGGTTGGGIHSMMRLSRRRLSRRKRLPSRHLFLTSAVPDQRHRRPQGSYINKSPA